MALSMTELQASFAVTLGSVDAYLKGLRGVFRLLAAQHREMLTLLARLAASREGQEQQRLWANARCRLLAHERAEMTTVYSLLDSFPTTEQLAQRHAHGARGLEAAVDELDSLAPGDPHHGEKLLALVALVNKHAAEEEGEYFVRAQAHIGRRRAESLLEPFERDHKHQLELLAVDQEAQTLRSGSPSAAAR
jgi:Hemerythrin HHE cation binding domain